MEDEAEAEARIERNEDLGQNKCELHFRSVIFPIAGDGRVAKERRICAYLSICFLTDVCVHLRIYACMYLPLICIYIFFSSSFY